MTGPNLRVGLCQTNPTVGDLNGNATQILTAWQATHAHGAKLAVFGEMALCGYPPEDLVELPDFVAAQRRMLDQLATQGPAGCPAAVGFCDHVEARTSVDGAVRSVTNAVALIGDGNVTIVHAKRRLPTHGPFDETRTMVPGEPGTSQVVDIDGTRVGFVVCEDLWGSGDGPADELVAAGAQVIAALNASPYTAGKYPARLDVLRNTTGRLNVPIVYVNLWGGQDELVFDGRSLVVDLTGTVVAQSPAFADDVAVVDVPVGRAGEPLNLPAVEHVLPCSKEPAELWWGAITTAVRDYVNKNRIERVYLGVSGGIDSALVGAAAVDALGPERVFMISLPGPYSSPGSISDAKALAANVGAEWDLWSISDLDAAVHARVDEPLAHEPGWGVAAQNIQSRLRGLLLMAAANSTGGLVLACGNRSEMAVGYFTLYGDSVGGWAPLRSTWKSDVFALARWRNAQTINSITAPIPIETIEKPPSAELAEDQVDEEDLAPYDVLDPILIELIEHRRPAADVAADGYDPALTERIARLVVAAEHKRRQTPPGPVLGGRSFGRERRVPITSRWPGT